MEKPDIHQKHKGWTTRIVTLDPPDEISEAINNDPDRYTPLVQWLIQKADECESEEVNFQVEINSRRSQFLNRTMNDSSFNDSSITPPSKPKGGKVLNGALYLPQQALAARGNGKEERVTNADDQIKDSLGYLKGSPPFWPGGVRSLRIILDRMVPAVLGPSNAEGSCEQWSMIG
jgi:hypothetical protein